MKRAPGAPKRFKSSYILFFVNVQDSIKQSLPPGKSSAPAVSKIASQMWKNLSAEDRAYWDEESLKDKKRYDSEKLAYTGPWEVPKKRIKKDKNAPRRNPSAFLLFSKIRRRQIRDENPQLKNTDVSIMLGNEWRNASHAVKLPFIRQEEQEREIYKQEMGKWKTQKEMEQTMTDAISDKMQKEMEKKIADVLLSQMQGATNGNNQTSSSSSVAASAAAVATINNNITPLFMKQYIAALDNIRNIVTPQATASAAAAIAAASLRSKNSTPPPQPTPDHKECSSSASTVITTPEMKKHHTANVTNNFNTPTTNIEHNESNIRYDNDVTMKQAHSSKGHNIPVSDPFATFGSDNVDFICNNGHGGTSSNDTYYSNSNETYISSPTHPKSNFVTPTRIDEFVNIFEENYDKHPPPHNTNHKQVESEIRKPQPYTQGDPRIIEAVKSYQNSLMASDGNSNNSTNNDNSSNNHNNNNMINKPDKQEKNSPVSIMCKDFSFEPAPFDVSDCFHNFDVDDSTVDFLPAVLDNVTCGMDSFELDEAQFDEFDPIGETSKSDVAYV